MIGRDLSPAEFERLHKQVPQYFKVPIRLAYYNGLMMIRRDFFRAVENIDRAAANGGVFPRDLTKRERASLRTLYRILDAFRARQGDSYKILRDAFGKDRRAA